MNKIKAAIIEDEIPAARLLRDTLCLFVPIGRYSYCPVILKRQ